MALPYRSEIDGLRALAIIPVVLFHLGFSWIPGGFVGVDVFFVISGYLISGILLSDLKAGSFTFRNFWTRRVMRIFPALLAMVACTLITAWIITPRTDHPVIGQQALAALLSVANLWFWQFASNYWGSAAEASPFLHTWSLSLEEQFYLCLPPLLWASFARGPRVARSAIAVTTIASGLLFALGVARSGFSDVFYLLPTRAWELGIGGCLAAMPSTRFHGDGKNASRISGVIGLFGVSLIIAMCVLTPGRTRAVIGAVSGAALVIAFGHRGACHRLLSLPPFVGIGKLSYSMYLWHWPVIVLADFLRPVPGSLATVGLFATLTLISYFGIEQPTRRCKACLPYIGVAYLATLAIAACMALSSGTYDTSAFARQHDTAYLYDLGHLSDDIPLPSSKDRFSRSSKDEALRSGGLLSGPHAKPEIVVFGDSHGVMWCPEICTVAARLGATVALNCANGVSPFIAVAPNRQIWDDHAISRTEKEAWDHAKLHAVESWKPCIAILCAKWSGYTEADANALLTFLSAHVDHILLIQQPPMLDVGNRPVIQWLCYEGVVPDATSTHMLPEGDPSGSARSRELLSALAAKYPKCSVVPIHDLFAVAPDCVLALEGKNVVYYDDDHLSEYGVSLASHRLQEAIAERYQPQARNPGD